MMTREQAIKLLEYPIYKWSMDWDEREDGLNYSEVIELAISALRPVSREQVEKVWRGEWINKHSAYDHKIFTCARCGKQISIQGENLNFCPACGAAQTDKAVEMVMERLEALYEQTKAD